VVRLPLIFRCGSGFRRIHSGENLQVRRFMDSRSGRE
jgi:hypothetical protein